jgi:hypothetical protein
MWGCFTLGYSIIAALTFVIAVIWLAFAHPYLTDPELRYWIAILIASSFFWPITLILFALGIIKRIFYERRL